LVLIDQFRTRLLNFGLFGPVFNRPPVWRLERLLGFGFD